MMEVDNDDSDAAAGGSSAIGGQLASLAGFLFGNIDDAGRLVDDDVLDEDSRRHLDGLTTLGAINSLVDELTDDAPFSSSAGEDSASFPSERTDADDTDCHRSASMERVSVPLDGRSKCSVCGELHSHCCIPNKAYKKGDQSSLHRQ